MRFREAKQIRNRHSYSFCETARSLNADQCPSIATLWHYRSARLARSATDQGIHRDTLACPMVGGGICDVLDNTRELMSHDLPGSSIAHLSYVAGNIGTADRCRCHMHHGIARRKYRFAYRLQGQIRRTMPHKGLHSDSPYAPATSAGSPSFRTCGSTLSANRVRLAWNNSSGRVPKWKIPLKLPNWNWR
jgi:hypothetical protein